MFKSLKVQLLSFFFIANLIILSGFSIFIYSTAQKGILDNLDTLLKLVSIDTTSDIKNNGYVDANNIANELIKEFRIEPLLVKIIYYNKKTNSIDYETSSLDKNNDIFDIPLNEKGHERSIYYFDKKNYRVSSMLLFENSETKFFFQLSTKKITDSSYLKKLLMLLLIANPIILILFLFIANALINYTLRPVEKVIKSVESISTKQSYNSIDISDIPIEIKNLVDTFNDLLEKLYKSFDRISTFSSDASHELKTPLTVIRGEIEVSLRQNRTPQEYKIVLNNLLSETVHIQEIIEQLFFINKKDTTELNTNFENIYLDEIITDVIEQIKDIALKKFIKIDVKLIPITIYANQVLLKVAINNIIKNAILYSQENSEINIYIEDNHENGCIKLIIEDNGIGISKEDLPFIFDRFYRAAKSRSRGSSGSGLGMSIVKMILDIHKFKIDIFSVENKGTKVTIKIPK